MNGKLVGTQWNHVIGQQKNGNNGQKNVHAHRSCVRQIY